MRVLIKSALLFHPSHPLHGKKTDILIADGIILRIGDAIEDDSARVVSSGNLCVSAGWVDCFANFCDPGEEYKETLESGAKAAAAGGYTDVMIVPNTTPEIQNKSQVQYVMEKSRSTHVNIHPIGAVTVKTAGEQLTEMYDMASSGAVAFSDGLKPIQSSGIMQKALEYLLAIRGVLIQLPDDNTIGTHGQMNEGVVSTRLGMQGKPALSEELMIARDIELVRYTQSSVHFTGVSTAKSIALIDAAKKEGLNVTCSVTPYHLCFCDEDLADYDTTLKVNPPLRTAADRDALREAVKSGVVDCIASHHLPQDYDHKVCEFEKAAFGMETLESVFGAIRSGGISADRFVEMQTQKAREIFGLSPVDIKEGAKAVLTLFDPDCEYVFSESDIQSMSKNNGFVGKTLKGKAIGIINKDGLFLSDTK
ncbi:MAG TPA: dihydroorotase [Ginsengibacter sp.]|nr:dihydroorotase [Ginsengibacter sp.]